MAYTVALAVFIFAFWHSPNIAWVQWLAVAAVGAALYGPQMLIGLCGAEAVSKSAVSAAQGFLGCDSHPSQTFGIDLSHRILLDSDSPG